MTAQIKQISGDDWLAWRQVRIRSVQESPEAFSTSARTVTTAFDSEPKWRSRIEFAEACFLAYEGQEPVGMVAVDPADHGRLQLVSMFVGAEARGQGVGAGLIQAVVEVAAGRPLYLRVMDGNAVATRVYERAGFVLDGCDADEESCLSMTYTG